MDAHLRPTTSLTRVTEYQVTYWRDLPSMVVAREGDSVTKGQLASRFQEAIDEAAMRLGAVDSEAYLEGWSRGEWTATDGGPADVCDRVVADLEAQWPPERLTAYLDGLNPN
jgi:hypothetical protein